MSKLYKEAPPSVITVNGLKNLDISEINSVIERNSYVCIKGLFDKNDLKKSVKKLISTYSPSNDNSSIGEEGMKFEIIFKNSH